MRLPVRLLRCAATTAALFGPATAAALDMRLGDRDFAADRMVIRGKAAPNGRALRVEGVVEGLDVPSYASGATVETRLDVGFSDGALTLGPDSRLRAVAETLGPALAPWLPATELRLEAAETGKPTVRLSADDGGWRTDLNLIARAGAARLTLTHAALRRSAAETRLEAQARAAGLILSMGAGRIEATADRISVTAQDGSDAALEMAVSGLAARTGGIDLTADDFAARVTEADGGAITGSLSLRRLRDRADMPWLAPFDISGEAAWRRQTLTLRGDAGPSGGPAILPWQVEVATAGGGAAGRLGPATLTFGGSGVDPAAISPRLAALAGPEGTVTLEAAMALADGAVESEGRVRLQGLSVRTAMAAAEGVNGDVALAALLPPRTAGMQEVTAERVVAAVPFEDARLRFRVVEGAEGPAVEVASARAGFAGAELSTGDARFDLSTGHGRAVVALRGLALSRLFETLALEDFSGTGTLEGSMPVEVTAAGVAVGRGTIAATGPGRLTVGFGAARETLMAQGEYVQMMVRALEDFHYDGLSVSARRPVDGDLGMDVTLTGNNPQVLDGHPFRFNISLKGDIDPIVDALREGRRLTGDLLRGTLERQP